METKKIRRRKKIRLVDKDSAEFHKEFLDNEDEILSGLDRIAELPDPHEDIPFFGEKKK